MIKSKIRTAAVAIALTLMLSGCSSTNTDSKEESIPMQPICSTSEVEQGSAWIKGQLDAFNKEDPETAYNFASEKFRASSTLNQFVATIVTSYGFLLGSRSYTIGDCTKQGELFNFDVQVIDTTGQKFPMKYTLSKIANTWGVDSAAVTVSEDKPTYS